MECVSLCECVCLCVPLHATYWNQCFTAARKCCHKAEAMVKTKATAKAKSSPTPKGKGKGKAKAKKSQSPKLPQETVADKAEASAASPPKQKGKPGKSENNDDEQDKNEKQPKPLEAKAEASAASPPKLKGKPGKRKKDDDRGEEDENEKNKWKLARDFQQPTAQGILDMFKAPGKLKYPKLPEPDTPAQEKVSEAEAVGTESQSAQFDHDDSIQPAAMSNQIQDEPVEHAAASVPEEASGSSGCNDKGAPCDASDKSPGIAEHHVPASNQSIEGNDSPDHALETKLELLLENTSASGLDDHDQAPESAPAPAVAPVDTSASSAPCAEGNDAQEPQEIGENDKAKVESGEDIAHCQRDVHEEGNKSTDEACEVGEAKSVEDVSALDSPEGHRSHVHEKFMQDRSARFKKIADLMKWPEKILQSSWQAQHDMTASNSSYDTYLQHMSGCMSGLRLSTAFSGIDTPAVALDMLSLGIAAELKLPLGERASFINTYAVEWFSKSREESPVAPKCVFGDMNLFWQDQLKPKLEAMQGSEQLAEVVMKLFESMEPSKLVRTDAYCYNCGTTCSVACLHCAHVCRHYIHECLLHKLQVYQT